MLGMMQVLSVDRYLGCIYLSSIFSAAPFDNWYIIRINLTQ
jgi:hypothetical protein